MLVEELGEPVELEDEERQLLDDLLELPGDRADLARHAELVEGLLLLDEVGEEEGEMAVEASQAEEVLG